MCQPPAEPMQLPAPPTQLSALPVQPPVPPVQLPLNWSHLKPEFSGRPDEDAEAHLLRTNDQMRTHNFPEETKVQRFCLTLVGEGRLW